jgi:dipeptidyl aminopeptidase/acylaminoacyl peptidase
MGDLSVAAAMGPRGLYDLPIVGPFSAHPAQSQIVYVVTRLHEESNSYKACLKTLDTRTGATTVLTDGNARDQLPQWSVRGDAIFFTSDRSGGSQLWQVSATGGEATALPQLAGHVSEFALSPDGSRIAAVVTPTQGREAVERQGWRRITRIRYRADGPGYFDDLPRIYVLELATGSIAQITDGSGFVAGVTWSPDGTSLAYCADHGEDYDALWRRELWTVALREGEKPRRVLTLPIAIEAPAWSPDGKRIAFCGVAEPGGSGGGRNLRAFVADQSGNALTCWTAHEEWTCGNFVLTDVGAAGSLLAPVWLDAETLLVQGSDRGAARVFRVRSGARAQALTPENVSVSHFALLADALICCASDPVTPPELHVQAAHEGLRRLTRETQAWCAAMPSVGPRHDIVRTKDGTNIDAWHYLGVGASPKPCLLAIHGGPHFAYGYAFVYHFIELAAAGFDVVLCNPRGSQSYGEAFAQAIFGDWARPAYDDCMAALDSAIARGGIDATRLGVTGGSYGGYLTIWTIAHTNRFAAAAALRPATSLQSLWGTSEVGRMLAEDFGGGPDEVPDVYERDSPLTHAAAIRTPLLVIYGGQDYRTPAEQSEQLLTALLKRGATVEGLYFPGADHNLSRLGPPRQRVAHEAAILEWFERWLKPKA